MHNAYRGGTPDVWYSGKNGDLWVEYKWAPKVPKSGIIVPDLSPLQLKWLKGRFEEKRNVVVIVGYPDGCLIMEWPKDWTDGVVVVNNCFKDPIRYIELHTLGDDD